MFKSKLKKEGRSWEYAIVEPSIMAPSYQSLEITIWELHIVKICSLAMGLDLRYKETIIEHMTY